jgi:hypothetical protein
MSNKRVKPENKKIPMIVTVKKHIIDSAKLKAESLDLSLSAYIEKIMVKDI